MIINGTKTEKAFIALSIFALLFIYGGFIGIFYTNQDKCEHIFLYQE
jgi:hypothetical protein